jgi:transposase-like protein
MKEKEDTTKMGKVKYSPEMKEQTVKYILEGGKSASKVAVELGIDKNTICWWVREYREAHQMPTYEVERKIKKQSADELIARNKELEKELRRKEKELADEKEKVEILKRSLHIFMQAGE